MSIPMSKTTLFARLHIDGATVRIPSLSAKEFAA
jgi:hypothetical protein